MEIHRTIIKDKVNELEEMCTALENKDIDQEEWSQWSHNYNREMGQHLARLERTYGKNLSLEKRKLAEAFTRIFQMWQTRARRMTLKTGAVVGKKKFKKYTDQYNWFRKEAMKCHNTFVDVFDKEEEINNAGNR